MTYKQTVFVIDDDDMVRKSLVRSLKKRGFEVEAYQSAEAFLERFDENKTGCVVLDYGMPGMNGLELQEKLMSENLLIPIIFITGHGGIPESVKATKAGALDFLEKPFALHILLDHIRDAFELDTKLRTQKDEARAVLERRQQLTNREEEILCLLLKNPDKTSSKDIARELDISAKTVDIHRMKILQKMGAKSVVDLYDICSKVT